MKNIEDCACSRQMSKYQLGWFEAMNLIKEKVDASWRSLQKKGTVEMGLKEKMLKNFKDCWHNDSDNSFN